MKNYKLYLTFLLITGPFLISCNNTKDSDLSANFQNTDYALIEKVLGRWKIYDPSGNPDKTVNYVFFKNNLGSKFLGSNAFLVKSEEKFTYTIEKPDSTIRLTIRAEKSGESVYKLSYIDKQIMKLTTDINGQENDKKTIEMVREK